MRDVILDMLQNWWLNGRWETRHVTDLVAEWREMEIIVIHYTNVGQMDGDRKLDMLRNGRLKRLVTMLG